MDDLIAWNAGDGRFDCLECWWMIWLLGMWVMDNSIAWNVGGWFNCLECRQWICLLGMWVMEDLIAWNAGDGWFDCLEGSWCWLVGLLGLVEGEGWCACGAWGATNTNLASGVWKTSDFVVLIWLTINPSLLELRWPPASLPHPDCSVWQHVTQLSRFPNWPAYYHQLTPVQP